MPEISVVTPAYLRLEYLILNIRALHSIESDFEHLIVCNPGNDGMKEWLASIETSPYYHRLKVLHPKKHLGNADAMNYGIMASKGQYVAQLDADIEIHHEGSPNALEIFKYFLDTEPNLGAIGATLTGIGSKIPTKPLGVKKVKVGDESTTVVVEELPFITACFMMKRELLQKVGSYRAEPGKLISQMCSDLSMRIRASGKSIWRVGEVEAWHVDGTDLQGIKHGDYFKEVHHGGKV